MLEVWDVYDRNLNKIGKDCIRGQERLGEGEYHLIVNAIILNDKGEILIAKRAENRKNGLKWELTGGSVKKDETSVDGMKRELFEEIGLDVEKDNAILYKTVISDTYHDIKHMWLFKKNVDIEKEIKFNDGETIDAKYVGVEEYKSMQSAGEVIKEIDLTEKDFEFILNKYNK